MTINNKLLLLGASLFILSLVTLLWAASPRIKKFATQEDFKKGELKGISTTSQGELILAPGLETLFDTSEPFLWSWARDTQGNIYVGSGNEGKVFKIDPKGRGSLFFDAPELEIYSLAIDRQNNLYVATSPEGRIYKVSPTGQQSIFFDPPDKYIWSMVFDPSEALFVATGDSGIIYKVSREGKATIFFDSNETHIRVLTFDNKGRLLAGSVDNGYIYRISPKGDPFVLLDTPMNEVHSLAIAKDGTIYAAAYGQPAPRPPRPVVKKVIPGVAAEPETEIIEEDMEIEKVTEEQAEEIQWEEELEPQEIKIEAPQMEAAEAPARRLDISAIFKIGPEGTVKNIWKFEKEAIHSLTLDKDGSIIAGTGSKGMLYRIAPSGDKTLLLTLDDSQITALNQDNIGRLYLCTSNMGKVYILGDGFEPKGEYVSEAIDAETVSQWGTISWKASAPKGTRIEVFTRTGNTEKPNDTWSAWSPAYTQSEGQTITSPPSRFIQWKLIMTSDQKEQSPLLKSLSLAYLQKNLAPEVTSITINQPEEFYGEPSARERASSESSGELGGSFKEVEPPAYLERRRYQKGIRWVRWRAEDENDDQLEYDLYYRGEGEQNWRVLKEDLKKNSHQWDSQLMPDGTYFIKVVVTDAPSNPPALAMTSEKVSQPFEIDNTGPEVHHFTFSSAEFTFKVTDAMSPVVRVEYSLDAEDWKLTYPEDGICDSKQESFKITTKVLSKGTHTMVIRAYDALKNIGFGRFHFEVK